MANRIHLYTGSGEGKSTNAFGIALRALGHDQKVVIIQFMKGRKDIGEYLIKKKLGRKYSIHQFGRKEFIDLKDPEKIDYEFAKKGLDFAVIDSERFKNIYSDSGIEIYWVQ